MNDEVVLLLECEPRLDTNGEQSLIGTVILLSRAGFSFKWQKIKGDICTERFAVGGGSNPLVLALQAIILKRLR